MQLNEARQLRLEKEKDFNSLMDVKIALDAGTVVFVETASSYVATTLCVSGCLGFIGQKDVLLNQSLRFLV
jgi:hypothetical protein